MLYRNIVTAPDHAPYVREIRKAMPFIADTAAMGMATELVSYTERSRYTEMFEGFRLPHETVWLEHKTDAPFMKVADQITGGTARDVNERFQVIGYLFTTGPDDLVRINPFTADHDGDISEPFAGVQFSTQTGRTQVVIEHDIIREKMNKITRAGIPGQVASDFINQHISSLTDAAIVGAVIGSRLFTLMAAKDSPMDLVQAGAMSRQERRRLARKAGPGEENVPEVTRIVLNEEGRNHMRAVAEGSEASPSRKAHWVRGHLMRTETKGYVWRRSHVRGLGDPVMRPRSVSAISPETTDDPSPGF